MISLILLQSWSKLKTKSGRSFYSSIVLLRRSNFPQWNEEKKPFLCDFFTTISSQFSYCIMLINCINHLPVWLDVHSHPHSATLLSNSALCANLNTLGSPVQWPSPTVFLTLKSRIILLFAPTLLYWSWASVNTIPMCDLAIPIWTQHFLCFAPTERAVHFYPFCLLDSRLICMYLCTWAIIC